MLKKYFCNQSQQELGIKHIKSSLHILWTPGTQNGETVSITLWHLYSLPIHWLSNGNTPFPQTDEVCCETGFIHFFMKHSNRSVGCTQTTRSSSSRTGLIYYAALVSRLTILKTCSCKVSPFLPELPSQSWLCEEHR